MSTERRVYFNGWDGRDGVRKDFDIKDGELFPRPEQILFASYVEACYEGDAVVIYRGDDGELYEVQGGHCSCYGLEGQWAPDRVLVKQLAMRPRGGNYPFLSDHGTDAVAAYWTLVGELAIEAVLR